MIKDKKVKALKRYFEDKPYISMAFLFGSQARGKARPHSDWDVAIYFRPHSKHLELEERRFYPGEEKIWQDIEKILKNEVDLVILNRTPSSLAFSILNTGMPLVIKDRGIYLELLTETSYEAFDFRDFSYDFWRIKERASSLAEEDRARLLQILDFLIDEAADFDKFQSLVWDEYQGDRSKRREVERWIENIVNASLDIAKIILASKKKSLPPTYQETIRLLGTTGVFEPSFTERFSQWTRMRNILAHRYLDLRWEQTQKFIQESKQDVFIFIEKVKAWLAV